MSFASVPQWAWLLLVAGAGFFAIRNGWFKPAGATTGAPVSLLDSLQGYKTRLAALVIAILAVNELWHFLPDQYVNVIVYLAGALGLYGLRDAVERLKQKMDQIPKKE